MFVAILNLKIVCPLCLPTGNIWNWLQTSVATDINFGWYGTLYKIDKCLYIYLMKCFSKLLNCLSTVDEKRGNIPMICK